MRDAIFGAEFWRMRSSGARMVMTLAIAAAGAVLFFALGLPLPYMLGSLSVIMAAAIIGLPVGLPKQARPMALPVIGVMLGGYFTPALLAQGLDWWPAVAATLMFIILSSFAGQWFLHRLFGFDFTTAAFAAPPGGLSEMIVQTRARNGDEAAVSLVQSVRISAIVFLMPVLIGSFMPFTAAPASQAATALPGVSSEEIGYLIAVAIAGALIGGQARLPSSNLIGPFLLSALAHSLGLIEGGLPRELVGAAQIVLGATIGVRFLGLSRAYLARISVASLSWTIVLVLLASVMAVPVSAWVERDYLDTLLALSPGGLVEMSLISVSLGLDVTFVAFCHITRIVMVTMLSPFYGTWLNWRIAKITAQRTGQ